MPAYWQVKRVEPEGPGLLVAPPPLGAASRSTPPTPRHWPTVRRRCWPAAPTWTSAGHLCCASQLLGGPSCCSAPARPTRPAGWPRSRWAGRRLPGHARAPPDQTPGRAPPQPGSPGRRLPVHFLEEDPSLATLAKAAPIRFPATVFLLAPDYARFRQRASRARPGAQPHCRCGHVARAGGRGARRSDGADPGPGRGRSTQADAAGASGRHAAGRTRRAWGGDAPGPAGLGAAGDERRRLGTRSRATTCSSRPADTGWKAWRTPPCSSPWPRHHPVERNARRSVRFEIRDSSAFLASRC
jgi:hypothetical protein